MSSVTTRIGAVIPHVSPACSPFGQIVSSNGTSASTSTGAPDSATDRNVSVVGMSSTGPITMNLSASGSASAPASFPGPSGGRRWNDACDLAQSTSSPAPSTARSSNARTSRVCPNSFTECTPGLAACSAITFVLFGIGVPFATAFPSAITRTASLSGASHGAASLPAGRPFTTNSALLPGTFACSRSGVPSASSSSRSTTITIASLLAVPALFAAPPAAPLCASAGPRRATMAPAFENGIPRSLPQPRREK